MQIQSLVREDPWNSKRQPTAVFLPRKFHGQGSLAGYIPWDHKELGMTEHTSITLTLKNLLELGLLGRLSRQFIPPPNKYIC